MDSDVSDETVQLYMKWDDVVYCARTLKVILGRMAATRNLPHSNISLQFAYHLWSDRICDGFMSSSIIARTLIGVEDEDEYVLVDGCRDVEVDGKLVGIGIGNIRTDEELYNRFKGCIQPISIQDVGRSTESEEVKAWIDNATEVVRKILHRVNVMYVPGCTLNLPLLTKQCVQIIKRTCD